MPEIDCRRGAYVVNFHEGIIAVFRVRRAPSIVDASGADFSAEAKLPYSRLANCVYLAERARSQDLQRPFISGGKSDYSILNR